MKILIVGRQAPYRLEYFYAFAFRRLGIRVLFLDVYDVPLHFRWLYRLYVNKRLVRGCAVFRPDICLVFKGLFVDASTLMTIKKNYSQTKLLCYNPDNPFDTHRPGISNQEILKAIPLYDCYFIWSRLLKEKIEKTVTKNVSYLPFGFDDSIHYPLVVTERQRRYYGSDVVFVGNWDEEREKWLGTLTDFDLAIWGERYWLRASNNALKKRWRRRPAYGKKMSCVVNSSKISLNILRLQNKSSHNMRTFELPACGAFVLSERSDEIDDFFAEDKEVVLFSSPQELKDKINYYLKESDRRREIAYAGYRRCLAGGYSYFERAKQMLRAYERIK